MAGLKGLKDKGNTCYSSLLNLLTKFTAAVKTIMHQTFKWTMML